jgi:isopenicillin N synthase-like dioxygenase
MENLLQVIHRLSAYTLGLTSNLEYFNEFYFHRESNIDSIKIHDKTCHRPKVINGSALRISQYFPTPYETPSEDVNDENDEIIQYGAHTDYQGFTILRPDPRDWKENGAQGLQVQDQLTKNWIAVQLPGAQYQDEEIFVVNAGDLIQRWSNDLWISANHRVLGPKYGSIAASHSRQAIVFFSGPYEDVLIDSIVSASSEEVSVKKYEPIIAGEHLRLKLMRSNV